MVEIFQQKIMFLTFLHIYILVKYHQIRFGIRQKSIMIVMKMTEIIF